MTRGVVAALFFGLGKGHYRMRWLAFVCVVHVPRHLELSVFAFLLWFLLWCGQVNGTAIPASSGKVTWKDHRLAIPGSYFKAGTVRAWRWDGAGGGVW